MTVLATRAGDAVLPTRRDVIRLVAAAAALIVAMTAILAVDLSPRLDLQVGDLAPSDIRAPKALNFTNPILTDQAREAARNGVQPQYDYSADGAIATATEQLAALTRRIAPLDTAFASTTKPEQRQAILDEALPDLSASARAVLGTLDAQRWEAVRTEAARVLDVTERTELRDDKVAVMRQRLASQMAGGLSGSERQLASELIAPLLVPNSSYSLDLTERERSVRAAAVAPVVDPIVQGEVLVRGGTKLTDVDVARIHALGLDATSPDLAGVFGWLVVSI